MKITAPSQVLGSGNGGSGGGGGGGASGPAGGDLSGSYPGPTVVGLQGTPVCVTAPALNDVLTFDGTDWCPAAPTGGGVTGFATPAIVLGTTAAAGAATTVIASNSTIAAFDATVPPAVAASGSAGTGNLAARNTHTHAISGAAIAALGYVGPLLIADSHSTPLVFDDILQNEAGDDFLYQDI